MFTAAASYERFMGRWSRGLADRFVRFAEVRDGDAVLDVGCGTGAVAAAAALAAPSGAIVGVDPAEAYVSAAAESHRGGRPSFRVGDAQHLPFADAAFDRTLALLVLNFVQVPAQALAEMRRVTKPGGTVAAAVWDYADGMSMLRVFWDEAVALEPALEARDEKRMPLCRGGELAALWRAHGLRDVHDEALTIEMRFASFDDYWEPFLAGQGPAGRCALELGEPQRAELRRRLRGRLVGDGPDRPFALAARAWAARGTV